MRLVLASPRRAPDAARRWCGTATPSWCYLGTNLAQRERTASRLGPANRIGIVDALNRAANEYKVPFSDWIAEIGFHQPDRSRWWASRIASKIPVQTDIFLLVCYSRLVEAWASGRWPAPAPLVVVEDPWLLWMFRRWYGGRADVVALGRSDGRLLLDACYWVGKAPLCAAFTLRWALRSMLLSRLWFRRQPSPRPDGNGRAVLLYTWVEERSFGAAATFQDSYTGRLEELLTRQGERVLRCTAVKVSARLLWRLRSHSDRFIATARYLRVSDVVRAVITLFRIHHLRRVARFQQRDYSPLLYREHLREWGDSAFAFYRLSGIAMQRLARRWGQALSCVIYPYENQPWEKLLCMAFRSVAPRVRLIGYQHVVLQPLWLSYFPGKREFAFAPMPDRIVVNGRLSLELLTAGGYPPAWLSNGGALRYEHLLASSSHDGARVNGRHDRLRVLVVLPIAPVQAATLLGDLLELFPRPFLDDEATMAVEFIVKCHPVTPLCTLIGTAKKLPAWFMLSDSPVTALFKRADVFLAPPTSTARWEAYLVGLPVLKYQDDFLDIDHVEIPGVEVATICVKDTLKHALQRLHAAHGDAASDRVRRQVLEYLFSPVREEVWASLTASSEADA